MAELNYVPKFRDIQFKKMDDLQKWLSKHCHQTIVLKDFQQDLIQIHIHQTGEILETNAQGWIWIGHFIDINRLKEGEPLYINTKLSSCTFRQMKFICDKIITHKK